MFDAPGHREQGILLAEKRVVRTHRIDDTDDPWNKVRLAVVAFAAVLVSGTVAYRMLGLSWIDAAYQTLITVSTVGYTEVGTEITPLYRVTTAAVILIGVGTGVYTIGLVFEALMEGRLTDHLETMRMIRELHKMTNHIVICGWGQVGQHIADDLVRRGERAVVIDRRADLLSRTDCLAVIGEATDDETLVAAGVTHARALVVALDGEADNLFVTLSARALNPDLFIITRAVGPNAERKLVQAGANRVVNPHQIGAQRMASFVLDPNVADFLGETLHDRDLDFRLAEIVVTTGSALVGRTLADSRLLEATGLTLLAVRRSDRTFLRNPRPDFTPEIEDVLIVLGSVDQIQVARSWAPAPGAPG